ncbi:MAG TPA: beta-galactosidase GalA [Chitinophagaceae bacterium]|jgi:beta-galactosidase|nr:beta-galactosidase GalA [Chitinophagaceae bacterium]
MRLLLYYIFIFFFIFNFSFSYGQTSPRKKINIDDGWKFHFGHAADPSKDFNYSIATIFSKSGGAAGTAIDARFNDSSWRTLDLPHDWAVELPFVNVQSSEVESHGYKPVGGLFPETSIGWYRKYFIVSRADSGNRFQIQFDGIFRNASIWLNGFYLGNNLSGYIGASYDITDFVRFGRNNVLVVRVDATQYEGWFYEGAGIYRHVWLNQYNNLHIADGGLFVYADVQNKTATINLETTVENQNLSGVNCTVYSYITDRDGKQISQTKEQSLSLSVNDRGTVKQKILLSNAKLWSLDDPYLYRVVSVIKSGNKTVDVVKHRFGVRHLRFDAAQGFFLNGKHIKIQGTNNHQDHAGLGSALPDYLQYYRIRLLKNMGVNAYRTSHNPPTSELLDACDSLGMLMMDENRLLNSSSENMSQFERMILRDRNHPSVFLWSIGNEEGWIHTNSFGKRIAQTFIAKQKELDPSRTCTYAADVANVYPGVNEVIPIRGFNYRQFGVADYHRDHPNQPIVGTEMGSTVTTRGIYERDSVRGYVPDQDITAPWWASTAETWWRLAAPNDYWMGGFVWTGFDYRGEPTPLHWPNINSHFGIMDMCGFPKNIYYYYQSWWSDKDVLHISPHWNLPTGQAGWRGKEGQPIDVWVNSNADNVELFLNGKSLGKKDMPRNSHLQWTVPYDTGRLEAVGYKNGKRIISKVETTNEPNTIVVSPSKTTMIADGKDAVVINISVIDRQNREVPDANHLIRFTVSGDAKIIGVGNGDPSSHEPDKIFDSIWQRHLFNGHCQVILQAGTKTSMVHFEAKGDKLQTAATDIHTIQPGSPHPVSLVNGAPPLKQVQAKRPVDKMLGADISFLPQMEDRGIKYSDNGLQKDAIQILKDHGLNYIRLRLFVNPENDSGYSPKRGFCDLKHTIEMAKRVKAVGMKFLLDFHYSDTWADPQKQFKPAAWRGQNFTQLSQTVFTYNKEVIQELKNAGATPDMVQIGNEINHGMIWPEGHINNLDSLAQLVYAGIQGVKAVDPSITIMLHIALGGQNDESRFFLDNMIMRGVPFDVIGLSYYPRWHNTLEDLRYNLDDLAKRYDKDLIVVEYSQLKQEVNELSFNVAGGHGKGSAIWEPLNTWEAFFDRQGKSTDLLKIYDTLSAEYLLNHKQ